tara:strand:- start:69 stop:2594 length:2526 start_codon:yes stop_codon:yes gene_type:complete
MATSKEKLQIIVDAQGIAKTKAQLKGMDKASGGATKSFGLMAVGIAGATAALYAMGKATSFAIRVGKDFEQGMANVKAISGATGAEFKALEANASLLGRTTKFTATQISGLQTEFAKLGFTATEITKVTKGTLALAAATGSDLAVSAEVAGATLRGFGLDVSETGRVTDVMAKSFSSSALDMSKFSDSMKFVAPVAKMAGFGLEGTTAMLGKLANAGLHGSMAGTALRSIFLKLADTNSALSKRLGGSVNSAEELIPALNKLKDEGVDLTEMLELTDKRAVTAFGVLLDGVDGVDELAESLRNAGGSAQRMADIQLDTLEGKMTIMKSATEGLGIALFDHLAPGLKEAVEGITGLISSMTQWLAIPASAKLQDETQKVNNLSTAIQMAAVGSENRNRLVLELNSIQPDLLKGLSDEEIAQGKLTERLKEYNAQQTLKIALVKADEETLKLAEKKAEVDVKVADSTMAVTDAMIDLADSMGHALDPQKSMAENYEILMDARDEMIKGMTREEKWSDSGIKAVDDSAQARMRLITAYKAGEPGVESYIDLLVRQEEMAGKLATAEEIQARKREILNEMYAQAPAGGKEGGGENGDGDIPGVPTQEQMEIKLSELDEFYMAEHMLLVDKLALEEAIKIEAAEDAAGFEGASAEKILEIRTLFARKRQKLDDKTNKIRIKQQQDAEMQLLAGAASALAQFRGGAIAAARIQQIAATIDAYRTITKIMADPKLVFPTNVITATAVGLQAFAQVTAIGKSIGEFGGRMAQFGMSEVVDKPTMIMAGEAGAESVQITPLEGPNLEGPQGGGGITVNVSGNVLTEDFVTEELAEIISESIRRGTDFGIS